MRALIIDNEVKARIQEVINYAKSRPHNLEIIKKRMSGDYPVPGDEFSRHTCYIECGFKCVYTIEEHPCGWCHHLSISVDEDGKVPAIEAIKFLMKEFGIEQDIKKCLVFSEDISETRTAVNIIAKSESDNASTKEN
jgi:hypothetical protein